jgi:hypothetical protein
MSYCRWSSDGFQCDVYAYEDVYGGFTVHVAANRRPRRVTDWLDGTDPHDPDFVAKIQGNCQKQREELDDPTNQPQPIGGPVDGESYHCDTLEELLECLTTLRDAGYKVPAVTLSSIQDEINEK